MSEDLQSDSPAVVELNVPASSVYVAILRSVTAGLAARCDLTLDEMLRSVELFAADVMPALRAAQRTERLAS